MLAHVDEVRLRKLSVEVEGTAAAVLATDDLSRLTLQLRKGDEELAQIDAELLDAPDSEGSADRAANAVRRFRAVIPLKTLLSQGSAKVYVRAIDSAGAETGFIRVGLNESAHLSTRRLGLTFDAGSTTLGGMNLHASSGLKAVARSVLGRNGRPAG